MSRGASRSRAQRALMVAAITIAVGPCAAALAASATALAAPAHELPPTSAAGQGTTHKHPKGAHGEQTSTPDDSFLSSPELWATVDVCNPSDQPDTIGIRGSMPGDGHAEDEMFMRFEVQYLSTTTHAWMPLSQGGESAWVKLGSASATRQAGQTFQFVPEPGEITSFTLRGLVSFQWRRGPEVVHSTSKTTSEGHKPLAGSDPEGFSAASCLIA